MTNDRSSEADEPQLVGDKQAIARIEAENTLKQFDATIRELQAWLGNDGYQLRPSTILGLNRVALNRLSRYAGIFRPGSITIRGSSHAPVPAELVPRYTEEFCDYVNANWKKGSAVHLAAYALWRLNWIHPFVDGNGRTARVISYLILCAKMGYRLPGTKTIPEQIAQNKQPYYLALEAADKAYESKHIDVSELEDLLEVLLATQLVEVHNDATGTNLRDRQAVADIPRSIAFLEAVGLSGIPGLKRAGKILRWIENHPVFVGLVGIIVAAILAYFLKA
jgi:Fic family protein